MDTQMDTQENKNPDFIEVFLLVEQVTGIGPAYLPWQGNVLPLNYTCIAPKGFAIINTLKFAIKMVLGSALR